MQYAFLTFLIVFVLLGAGLLLAFYRGPVRRRVAGVISTGVNNDIAAISRSATLEQRLASVRPRERRGGRAGSEPKAYDGLEKGTTVVERRMILAGYRGPSAPHLFFYAKMLVPAALCLAAFVSGAYHWNAFIVFLLALGLGYLVPDYWVDRRIKEREIRIQEGLPDLMDLLVICLESGLSTDQAALRSTEELRAGHPVIADEIGLVMLEVRAGKPRLEAWQHLVERTNVEGIRLLVAILVQADQFGTGVSKTLRAQAESMRARAKQRVEELAAKTAVKLVFPLVLFIFPALFVVLLGPAIISIVNAFK